MILQQLHWWKSGVIYQIYLRSFHDSNGESYFVKGYTDGVVK